MYIQTRRSAPARAPAPQTQQTRQAHTAPVRQQPVQHQAPPAPQQHAMTPAAPAPSAIAHPAPQQPGLFAQSKSGFSFFCCLGTYYVAWMIVLTHTIISLV